ncbi:cytochrome P450 [Staphylotrichum tortipilum]|uniref:Cytochrome P450 n=1 Tax=Staphylotrichum tortipilum TaxID=2831512 RepID=A0AAN6MGY7_9PEZI|nr:cytochrome P450 [Staphylotrichum longicolle]
MAWLSRIQGYAFGLPPSTLILSLAAFVLISNILYRIVRWRRLRHVPGPPLAGWTSLWLTRAYMTHGWAEHYTQLAAKYGPVVRVAPNKVVVNDVETLYRISSVRSEYGKDDWYRSLKIFNDGHHIVTLMTPDERRERKKAIGPGYMGRDGVNFEVGADKGLQSFIDLIERKYISERGRYIAVDLNEKILFYAIDSIGEIAYSNSFGMVDNDTDMYGIVAANDAALPLARVVGDHLWLHRMIHRWPLSKLLPRDGDEVGLGAVIGRVNELVTKRLNPDPTKPKKHYPDMLQSFIQHGIHGHDLRQEVGVQFFAGSDTVASFLRTTLLLLITHPTSYLRLQAEIDAAYAAAPWEGIVRDAVARDLPYLQAVVREGLRMFPPAVVPPFWKTVQPGGDELLGFKLPAGTGVCTSTPVWVSCREEGFWGGDAAGWRPERW